MTRDEFRLVVLAEEWREIAGLLERDALSCSDTVASHLRATARTYRTCADRLTSLVADTEHRESV